MKPIEAYKDAVMQRVEDKKRARKRAMRRTLAVCLPLCLCLGILGAVAFDRDRFIGEDHVPELNGADRPNAAVWQGDTVVAVMDDADAVYTAILALYDADGNLTGNSCGGVDDPTDGADAESFTEEPKDNSSTNGNAPYYLRFIRPDGEHVFLLQNNMLTDLTDSRLICVTEEQAQALISGNAP